MGWYVEKVCEGCGDKFYRHHLSRFCFPCCAKRSKEASKRQYKGNPNNLARRMVSMAIRLGVMRPASEFNCVDCGSPAAHYDHRDYNKPLDVDPVCIGCHGARGRGINFVFPAPGPLASDAEDQAA